MYLHNKMADSSPAHKGQGNIWLPSAFREVLPVTNGRNLSSSFVSVWVMHLQFQDMAKNMTLT